MPAKNPVLAKGRRVYLRTATRADERAYLKAVQASRDFIDPWGVPPHTPKQFRDFIDLAKSDQFLRMFICRRTDDALVGMINLNEIIRYKVQNCYVGYTAFAPFHGQGYLTEGLKLVMRHTFTRLKLHRIEAGIQSDNVRSIRLAERAGFHFEGLARRLVKINGRWQDHERWAILREEWQGRWKRPKSPLKAAR